MAQRLADEDWLTECQRLPFNSRNYTYCICDSKKKTLGIYNNADGWSAYCHKCHSTGFKSKGMLSIQEALNEQRLANGQFQTTVAFPDDATTNYDTTSLTWLVRNGIDPAIAERYGFKYSPSMRRLLMPIVNRSDSRLLGIQARAVQHGVTPKYLDTMAINRNAITFDSHSSCHDTVCITEDIASTVKIGQVTQSVSLLGTRLGNPQLQRILAYKPTEIVVWLDADEAGRTASVLINKQLELMGIKHRDVVTQLDPKHLPLQTIREILL